MRKYESIKRIDLTDRQSINPKQSKVPQSAGLLQFSSRSSKANICKQQYQNIQCLTDRSRVDKINEFNVSQPGQNTNSNIYSVQSTTKSNIRTFIRFKPFTRQQIMKDNTQSAEAQINIENNKVIIDNNQCYSFDKVFDPEASQKIIYEVAAKELIKSFMNGYNGTIFAYGQTGSGKTYTMFGGQDSFSSGIIPLSIEDIFKNIDSMRQNPGKITLSCSMYQIYKEIICDLMSQNLKEIKIKQGSNGIVQIQNLAIKQITKKQEVMELINKGSQLRKTRQTQSNERSSRSHLILTLYLNVKINDYQQKNSKLNLVDLAGSQKVSKTKVSGEGLEEAIKINLSLSCLGNAINALSRGQDHIPFRDSKLTRVLQQSLAGNSITRVIVTCSMLPSCKQQTISSLKFANRIKKIKTASLVNIKKLSDQGVNKYMYQTLKASFQNCEQKLEKIKNLIEGGSYISTSKLSKQEILENLKMILSEQKYSENQFLNVDPSTFQAFRSPTKYQIPTEYIQQAEFSTTKYPINSLNEHIKNLEEIIIKQQKIIEEQQKEIEKYKQKQDKTVKNQGGKSYHKVKITKTNSSTNPTQNAQPTNVIILKSNSTHSSSASKPPQGTTYLKQKLRQIKNYPVRNKNEEKDMNQKDKKEIQSKVQQIKEEIKQINGSSCQSRVKKPHSQTLSNIFHQQDQKKRQNKQLNIKINEILNQDLYKNLHANINSDISSSMNNMNNMNKNKIEKCRRQKESQSNIDYSNSNSNYNCNQQRDKLLNSRLNQILSFTNMEKQVLAKQVNILIGQNKHLKRVLQQSGNQSLVTEANNTSNLFSAILTNITEIQLSGENFERENWEKKLEQKNLYIMELQKLISSNKCGCSSTRQGNSFLSKKQNFGQSIDNKNKSISKRCIQLYTSPTSSAFLSRVGSAKKLFRV